MRATVDGLILRESAVGESDKLLTLLTAEHGKMTLLAKGARSIKSKNLSVCRPLTYGNFEYYEKNGMRWLSSGSPHTAFFGDPSDLEDFFLAVYISDVACEITGEGVDASAVLKMTLNTLYAIEKKLKPREMIKGVFELFAASHSGFTPDLSACRECGDDKAESFYIDVMNGSCLCSECVKRSGGTAAELDRFEARNILLPLSASALAAARYVLTAKGSRIFAFELKQQSDIDDLSRFGETYLHNHLERGFDTLEFYRNVSKPL